MESIQGKTSRRIERAELDRRLAGYRDVLVDLGTGDGRYVLHQARALPAQFAIGIDACREGLRDAARRAPCNALYLAANAEALPEGLAAIATAISVNFPWGSLLAGLLDAGSPVWQSLAAIARPGAAILVRLNGSALAAEGCDLAAGSARISRNLALAGWHGNAGGVTALDGRDLRELPTTWAKRMAFGRQPWAIAIKAVWPERAACELAGPARPIALM